MSGELLDHRGSIDLVTDEAGLATETRSFDPWGKTRNADWTAAAIDPPLAETPRGFTDHEHIQTVGLIHMNGRVQDPVLGRFISPDPSDALNPGVGFNRYAYALNNPLSLVDPDGFETTPGSDDNDFDPNDALHNEGGSLAPREWDPESRGQTRDEYDFDRSGIIEPFALEDWVSGPWGAVKGLVKAGIKQVGRAIKEIDDAALAAAEAAAKKAEVVVGENMERVNEYAKRINGETIDDWMARTGRKWDANVNREWVEEMKKEGRTFQDIGPDFDRRMRNMIDPDTGRPPSSIYGSERQALTDYGDYVQQYERTGKYSGGVPGFDN
ncbi:MAG: RHS repeat-associated core domain-containing protein [Alphaproteobacteria bacterium]|nr:RHS repeat-associated core domain-containing protein [Alphaproteobacteria bacterium]